MVLLVADLQELKANPDRRRSARSSRPRWTRAAAPIATALVQTGTLKVGDIIVVGETFGRVRALENDRGKRVKQAGPASAVVVLGLSEVPEAGDILRVVADEKAARTMVEQRKADRRRQGRRRQRSGDARGPVPPDPGRPGQGAADHPQGRRVGLAGCHHPRARAARPGRGPDQRPARGRRRHHRQRHHARDRVGRDRRRLQHEASPRPPAGPPRPRASTSGCTTSSTS